MKKSLQEKKEFLKYSGIISEGQDDYVTVQNMLPSLELSKEQCADALNELNDVIDRLNQIKDILKNDQNNLHLPAEANWLSGKLRNCLRNALSMESPIRKALTTLENI